MTIKKWSIYRANLDPVVGSEQGKSRPVLIISEDQINSLLNTVNIIPISTRKPGRKIYPNEVLLFDQKSGLSNESVILCHQIRTLDKLRLSKKYGNVDDPDLQTKIVDALIFQLGLELEEE